MMKTSTKTDQFTIKVLTNKELTEQQIEELIDKMFENDPNIFYAERVKNQRIKPVGKVAQGDPIQTTPVFILGS